MHRTIKIFILTIILLSTLDHCFAANFYCGKHVVAIGDTTFDVLMKCEKPGWMDHNKVEVIKRIARGDWKKIILNKETWLYNFGPNQFIKTLIFENDRLIKIESGKYGYDK